MVIIATGYHGKKDTGYASPDGLSHEELVYATVSDYSQTDVEDHEMYETLANSLLHCFSGVLSSWLNLGLYIVLSSCSLRFLSCLGNVPPSRVHSTSALLGFCCVMGVLGWHGSYVFTFAILALSVLYVTNRTIAKWRAPITTVFCLMLIIGVGEFQLGFAQWNTIKGVVMLVSMKVISLASDLDSKMLERLPPSSQLLGYVLHCSTVLFGPWISFFDYQSSIERGDSGGLFEVAWIVAVVRALLLSMVYLVISSCGLYWLMDDVERFGVWATAFREAMAFRMSHYFICFFAEAAAVAGGVSRLNRKNFGNISRTRRCSEKWNLAVVSPRRIELPRSLVEVVVRWNHPMHVWLKHYVYRPLAMRYGRAPAVLGTFGASSILHGLNFRLSCILISLGCYTYLEFTVREKLSKKLSACIGARACQPMATSSDLEHMPSSLNELETIKSGAHDGVAVDHRPSSLTKQLRRSSNHDKKQCLPATINTENLTEDLSVLDRKVELIENAIFKDSHKSTCCKHHNYTESSSRSVRFINLVFSVLAIIHLIYLGSAFNGESENYSSLLEATNTIHYTLKKWKQLNFLGHWMLLVAFLFNRLI